MKYFKLALSTVLAVVCFSQYFIYGFLPTMILWSLYALFYLAISVYQKFHKSSVGSQVFSLIYICIPLIAVIAYAAGEGLPQMTRTFYIVLIAVLALAAVWEIVCLFFAVRESSDEKKRRR